MKRLKGFLQKHRRKIKWILLSFLASLLVLVWLAYIASVHAAQIFNREMAKQHFFDGTITVERLTATLSTMESVFLMALDLPMM